ncbi:hypothetical protein REPUB_Repub08aG0234300 [Reevesia pubescens]
MEKAKPDQVVLIMDQANPIRTRSRPHKQSPEPNDFEPLLDDVHESSTDDHDDDEDEWNDEFDEDDGEKGHKKPRKKKRILNWRRLTEWVLFFVIMTCLICSLTIKSLKIKRTCGLEIWKWCLMVLVTFCGRLVPGWLIAFAVFLIERNFMLREKVLYFVYGLRKSIQNCIWPRPSCVHLHVRRQSSQTKPHDAQKGLSSISCSIAWRNYMAFQDRVGQNAGLIFPRRNLL